MGISKEAHFTKWRIIFCVFFLYIQTGSMTLWRIFIAQFCFNIIKKFYMYFTSLSGELGFDSGEGA